jgi:hypothetical protein
VPPACTRAVVGSDSDPSLKAQRRISEAVKVKATRRKGACRPAVTQQQRDVAARAPSCAAAIAVMIIARPTCTPLLPCLTPAPPPPLMNSDMSATVVCVCRCRPGLGVHGLRRSAPTERDTSPSVSLQLVQAIQVAQLLPGLLLHAEPLPFPNIARCYVACAVLLPTEGRSDLSRPPMPPLVPTDLSNWKSVTQ